MFAEPIVDLSSGAVRRHLLTALPIQALGDPMNVFDLLETALQIVSEGSPVAVPLDARAVADPETGQQIELSCLDRGVQTGLLSFEVSEATVLGQPRMAGALITRLHAAGNPVSVTHFGSAMGGLQYVKRLPVSTVKLAPEITSRLASDRSSERSIAAAVALAAGLGLATAAEGIDDRSTLEALEDLGVDEGQGMILGVPLPAEQLLRRGARSMEADHA